MSFAQIIRRRPRKTVQQQWLNLLIPSEIHYLFVRQHGVSRNKSRAEQQYTNQEDGPRDPGSHFHAIELMPCRQ
jgi:hypothetical protein